MKVALFDGKPWRIRRRDALSMTAIPMDTDNGRRLLLSDSPRNGGKGRPGYWGISSGGPPARMSWYREVAPDVFEHVSGDKVMSYGR